MVHDDDLPSTKKLLRDYDTAQRICGPTTGVADDMGVAFFEA
jgi:hypothetical protein